MLTIKISKDIKIQKYLIKGFKLFLRIKDKWYCIKFNNIESNLIYYVIKLFNKKSLR